MEVHLSPELEGKLAHLAAQQGRDREALITEAVERLINYDTWLVGEVEKGLAQIDAGATLSHEEVGLRLASYVSSKQARG